MGTFIDLTGATFGKLLVLGQAENRNGRVHWSCQCECGNLALASTKKLRDGRKRSCGCLWLPAVISAKTKHGHSSERRISTELRIWMNMRSRCNAKTNPAYKNYGGRGISVCSRWDEFENFYADMGDRPSSRHSLDRYPDKNGNYEPSNCRWATIAQQARNRRNNIMVSLNGTEMCLADASALSGVPYPRLRYRVRANWSADRLFT